MQNYKLIKKILTSVAPIAIILLLLGGCVSTGSRYGSINTQYPLSANEYMQLAITNQGIKKQEYLLSAVGRYLQDKNTSQAQQTLYQVQPITPEQHVQRELLQGNIFVNNKNYSQAIEILQRASATNGILSIQQQIDLHEMLASSYQEQGDLAASIRERSALTPLLNTEERQQNLATIWQSLQPIDLATLNNLSNAASTDTLRGWYSLVLLTKQSQTPTVLMQNLNLWRSQYPNHPADALLPRNLSDRIRHSKLPDNIALLLPLHGKYSGAGNAIKNGFFTAYYYQKKNSQYSPKVQVIDTSGKDIVEIYKNAISQGADFIVGPLTKTNIDLISHQSISVPTLVLNSLPKNAPSTDDNLYLFGLSPTDEAMQAAQKAWSNHLSRAIVITPNTEWGNNISKTFISQWQSFGGTVVTHLNYTTQQQLSSQLQKVLNIDLANKQKQKLRAVLHEKLRYVTRRRKDFDFIFLAAQPAFARQIRPLLKFFYAGDIPVYAISTIYSGDPNPSRDHDLNGVVFCDLPWVLAGDALHPDYLNKLKQNIQDIWGSNYKRHTKLYALGIDAFNLVSKLDQMKALPQFGMPAATGELYLNSENHIYRKLPWAQFKGGKPKLIR